MPEGGELERSRVAYADHMRRSNERLALAFVGAMALVAVLPITEGKDRLGVIVAGAGLAVLIVLWFHAVPSRVFGDHRIAIFTVLVMPIPLTLIVLTGGRDSVYFPYLLLPVVVTVYSARLWHTYMAAGLAIASTLVIGTLSSSGYAPEMLVSWTANRSIEVLIFAALTGVVGSALRSARRNEALRGAELARSEQAARRLAFTDPLTGLFNRYQGDAMLGQFVADARRDRGFSVLALDIDDMKRINDTRGHAGGDAALVSVAEILRECLRGMDVPVRTGGDEFVVLLPATNEAQARRVAERIDEALTERNRRSPDGAFKISVGRAEWTPGMTAQQVLASADAALYRAKPTPGN